MFCAEYRDEIIQCQVEVMSMLTNIIVNCKDVNSVAPVMLCKGTVPILIGLARSMGRYTVCDGAPLLSLIFPKQELQLNMGSTYIEDIKREKFATFTPITRSMSGTFYIDSIEINQSNNVHRTGFPYDLTTFFFCKYGSSFNQVYNMTKDLTDEQKIRINVPIHHLQAIFAIAKRILTKETLEYLDEQASDVYNLHQINPYGYKSFSETINLVMVALLREMLKNQNST